MKTDSERSGVEISRTYGGLMIEPKTGSTPTPPVDPEVRTAEVSFSWDSDSNAYCGTISAGADINVDWLDISKEYDIRVYGTNNSEIASATNAIVAKVMIGGADTTIINPEGTTVVGKHSGNVKDIIITLPQKTSSEPAATYTVAFSESTTMSNTRFAVIHKIGSKKFDVIDLEGIGNTEYSVTLRFPSGSESQMHTIQHDRFIFTSWVNDSIFADGVEISITVGEKKYYLGTLSPHTFNGTVSANGFGNMLLGYNFENLYQSN